MKLSITFLPRHCLNCKALTRGRISGTRYEVQQGELYAEELVGVPLCLYCIARSYWVVPQTWLIAIARREQEAKARLAEWEAKVEREIKASVSR